MCISTQLPERHGLHSLDPTTYLSLSSLCPLITVAQREPLTDCGGAVRRARHSQRAAVPNKQAVQGHRAEVAKHRWEATTAAVHCSQVWPTSFHIKVGTGMLTMLKLAVKTVSVPPNHSSTPSLLNPFVKPTLGMTASYTLSNKEV